MTLEDGLSLVKGELGFAQMTSVLQSRRTERALEGFVRLKSCSNARTRLSVSLPDSLLLKADRSS